MPFFALWFRPRMADGRVVDTRTFHHDYISLAHNGGAFLFDEIMAVLSIRFQRIYLLQVKTVMLQTFSGSITHRRGRVCVHETRSRWAACLTLCPAEATPQAAH